MPDERWPFNRMKFLMLQMENKGKSVTYKDIADATGLSVNTVERYANNRVVRPDLRIVEKLRKFFGVSLKDFVIDDEGQVRAA